MSTRSYTSSETKLMNKVRESSNICYYCNKKIKGKRTVDHKTPISRGGLTVEENLCASCDKCNSEKGFLTEEEYMEVLRQSNDEINKDIGILLLSNLANTYKDIIDRIEIENKKISNCDKEIAEIQDIIVNSNISASDGYKLCIEIKDVLMAKKEAQKMSCNLGKINKGINSSYQSTLSQLDNLKGNIIKRCKNEYINSKQITLN